MSATSKRKTDTPGTGDQPMEDTQLQRKGNTQAAAVGPRGTGPVGFRDPGPDTQEKHTPADSQSPKAFGAGGRGGQEGPTLGALSETDPGSGGAFDREEILRDAKPADAERQRYAPDRGLEGRIPATRRDKESESGPEWGLGKDVAVPPGSVARQTGQTP